MDEKEKLSLFQDLVFNHTEKSVEKQLTSFRGSLKKILKDHKNEKKKKDKIILETEKENVRKERNKKHAQFQLKMQRNVHKEQEKLKVEVFNEVDKKLADFMETADYMDLLERKINQALKVAKDEEILIYLDPADADKVAELEQRTNHSLIVSDRSFVGGIRGVIQSRNMLIDYSFLKRLEAEKEDFSFDVVEEEDDR